jgi:hypothetical protein
MGANLANRNKIYKLLYCIIYRIFQRILPKYRLTVCTYLDIKFKYLNNRQKAFSQNLSQISLSSMFTVTKDRIRDLEVI